jgi:hypothetical protein
MPRMLYVATLAFLPTIALATTVSQDLAIQVTVGSSGSCQGNAGCGAGLVLVFDDEFTGNQLEYASNQAPTSMTWSAVGSNGHAALVFSGDVPVDVELGGQALLTLSQ